MFYLVYVVLFFVPPLCRSSNFKRQNTIDSASIKENTARLSAQNQRPASATHKLLTTAADTGKQSILVYYKLQFYFLHTFT